MDTEDFKPNSNRSKEVRNDSNIPERKVITGETTVRKKSEFRRFVDIFIPEDVASVRDHIVNDVIIPKMKNVISETIDTFLYGSSGGGYSRRSSGMSPSYRDYYDKRSKTATQEDIRSRAFSYDEIEFREYGDACEVLRLVSEQLDRYGTCTVASFYEYSNQANLIRNTHFKYGWMDISKARVVPFRGKYIIQMPKVMPLD